MQHNQQIIKGNIKIKCNLIIKYKIMKFQNYYILISENSFRF